MSIIDVWAQIMTPRMAREPWMETVLRARFLNYKTALTWAGIACFMRGFNF